MKIIKVDSCRKCPFLVDFNYKYFELYCDKHREKHIENIDIIPEWCTLEEISSEQNENSLGT